MPPARLIPAVTLALAVAAGGYVLRWGSDLPVMDEWDLLPEVLGGVRPGWLLDWHNEHRYPAGKLVWAAGLWASGFRFRTGMILSVGLLAVAALLLADAARRVRGRVAAGDVFLPAVLLHWGHGFNLLMGYQTTFVLFAVGLAGVAWAGVRDRPGWLLLFALLAAVSGGFGLASALALALALGWLARLRPWLLPGAAAVVGYSAWVAVNLPLRTPLGATAGPLGLAEGVAGYLIVGWGMPVVTADPLPKLLAGAAALGVFTLAGWGLRRMERDPAVTLGLVLVAHLGVAVAAAWGRNGGLTERMVTPAAAGLGVAWVAAAGRAPSGLGLALAVAVVGANLPAGARFGQAARDNAKRIEADIRAGLPPVFLAGRHGGVPEVLVGDRMELALRRLRDAGVRPFRDVGPDPEVTAVPAGGPFPLRLTANATQFRPGGAPPRAELVPPDRAVVGLRVAYAQHAHPGYQSLWLRWVDRRGGAHAAEVFPLGTPGRSTFAVPVGGEPAAVWLEPGCPIYGLTLEAAEWLVPAG